jgi:hypothetical protein
MKGKNNRIHSRIKFATRKCGGGRRMKIKGRMQSCCEMGDDKQFLQDLDFVKCILSDIILLNFKLLFVLYQKLYLFQLRAKKVHVDLKIILEGEKM